MDRKESKQDIQVKPDKACPNQMDGVVDKPKVTMLKVFPKSTSEIKGWEGHAPLLSFIATERWVNKLDIARTTSVPLDRLTWPEKLKSMPMDKNGIPILEPELEREALIWFLLTRNRDEAQATIAADSIIPDGTTSQWEVQCSEDLLQYYWKLDHLYALDEAGPAPDIRKASWMKLPRLWCQMLDHRFPRIRRQPERVGKKRGSIEPLTVHPTKRSKTMNERGTKRETKRVTKGHGKDLSFTDGFATFDVHGPDSLVLHTGWGVNPTTLNLRRVESID